MSIDQESISYINGLYFSDSMKIVMDWDYPYPGKRAALRRIKKLSLYLMSRYIPFLRRYCEDVYQEHRMWTEIYNEIEKLSGSKMTYGIRPDSKRKFSAFVKQMEKKYDTRLHLHMWFDEDKKIFMDKFGYEPKNNLISWIPKLDKTVLTDPNDIFIDHRCTEKDLKKIKKDDIMVFHPDHKERSLLLYLKLLNKKRGKRGK